MPDPEGESKMNPERDEIDWSGIKIGSSKRMNTREFVIQEVWLAVSVAILLSLSVHFMWPSDSFWTVMRLTAAGVTGGVLGGVIIRVARYPISN